MFNVSALLLDDALKPATPLINGAINETLRQFTPLSDDRLLQLVDYRESSTLIDHLLKGTPNSVFDWTEVWAVWGPHVSSINVTFSCRRYVSVFLAVYDGAPSCCIVQELRWHLARMSGSRPPPRTC